MTTKKTGFDDYFDERMKNPDFAVEYNNARAEIDATDELVRALDVARIESKLSKADLARQIQSQPEMVRRLFTAKSPNPTISTVLKLASVLGYRLELVPKRQRSSARASGTRRRAASPQRSQSQRAP